MPSNPEYWLSADLASPATTLSLHLKPAGHSPQLLAEREMGGSPLEQFLPCLDGLLLSERIKIGDLSRLVTSSGPGSFTGLRIAYSSLKGLSLALNLPIETMSGSEARAKAWLSQGNPISDSERLLAITPISQGRWAIAVFKPDGELEEEGMMNEIPSRLREAGGIALLTKAFDGELGKLKQELFPLRASYLGQMIEGAASRETFATLPEWIQASPRYLGETRFRELHPLPSQPHSNSDREHQ